MVIGIVLVVLLMASSGFVPAGVMPGWLHGFLAAQPVTQFVHAACSLLARGSVHLSGAVWVSLAWGVCLLLAVGALAAARRRAA